MAVVQRTFNRCSALLLTLYTVYLLCASTGITQSVNATQDTRTPEAPKASKGERLAEEAFHRLFFQANQSYLEGSYAKAAELYEQIVNSGHVNGHIFYNLANCNIRMNHLGKAILNYQKALLLIPRDEDCKANLRYARQQTMDRIEGVGDDSIWHTLAFWFFGLNFRELLVCFLALHALFWVSFLIRLYYTKEWIKWVFALSLILSIAMGLSGILKYRDTRYNKAGVILANEANVRAGFTDQDTVLYVLHEGAEFLIVGEEKAWYKIQLKDGKKGWLRQEYAGRVALPM